MKTKTIKISDKTKEVLGNSKIDGLKLFLPNIQLDRAQYVDVNKVLEEIGGKWNRGQKCHTFTENPAVIIKDLIDGHAELIDKKKTFQQFYTPANLAARLVELAEIKDTDLVLEPSAGRGALVKEILVRCKNLDIVELDKDNFDYLMYNFEFCTAHNDNFLSFSPLMWNSDKPYDKIIMNPPFTANQDIEHVSHAFKFLHQGGKLVAIMAGNTTRTKFQDLIKDKNYKIHEIEDGAFKESGTGVKTIILELNK